MVKFKDIAFIIIIISLIAGLVFYIYNVEQEREEFCKNLDMVYELKPANARCVDYINGETYHIIEIESKMYLEEKLSKCYNDALKQEEESQ